MDPKNKKSGSSNEKKGTRKILEEKPETIIRQLQRAGMLPKQEFQSIIESSISVLKFQPNILKAVSPAIVVGDLHGQFFDLIALFRRHGLPPLTKYVFLGDYVDRGDFSIEVITLLFWLKLKYPKSVYLLRGNHECKILTNTHNFKQQCKSKYNLKIYQLVIILFEVLPLCCIVDNKYFCVHAGISPSLQTLDQISKINRFCEIPEKGAMCDMLWSDPTDEEKRQWTFNSMRSCSYFYSRDHAQNFMGKNNLQMIIRGHEVQIEGYKYMQMKKVNRKNVLTIFSAPNYCDKYNNLGAVAMIEHDDIRIDTYKHVQHPYVLPNGINIFEWSLGIISNQAVRLLVELLKSRLMAEKTTTMEPIDKIKEKLDLCTQMQAIKKVIDDKQKTAKQLCKPTVSSFPLFSEVNCMESLAFFMDHKKRDEQGEAMPKNFELSLLLRDQIIEKDTNSKEQQNQQVQGEEGTISISSISNFTQAPKLGRLPADRTESQPNSEKSTQENKQTKNKQNAQIIGPKIQQFIRIYAKRK